MTINVETLKKFTYTWGAYTEPFTLAGKTYATDGYILLRVEEELEGVKERPDFAAKLAIVESLFTGQFEEPLRLSELLTSEQKEACPECDGTGTVSPCPECDGEGEIEYDSSWNVYTLECASCNGTGTISDGSPGEDCENCEGTGKVSIRTLVTIGNGKFDNRLLNKLINNLPESTTISPSENHLKAAVLKWEGGEGLIMPCRG